MHREMHRSLSTLLAHLLFLGSGCTCTCMLSSSEEPLISGPWPLKLKGKSARYFAVLFKSTHKNESAFLKSHLRFTVFLSGISLPSTFYIRIVYFFKCFYSRRHIVAEPVRFGSVPALGSGSGFGSKCKSGIYTF